MRLSENDHDHTDSLVSEGHSEAGASAGPSNGHNGVLVKSNGFCANGTSKVVSDGVDGGTRGRGASIARVSLPGSTLYDNSYVDREEFVRLVIQSLRDVGYIESAATLEAESGYVMEAPEVAEFRRCILDGSWERAQATLLRLGVEDDERLWEARFLINQQKYLELLEAQKTTAALHVLRNELAPMHVDPDQLHSLSSLMMCSDSYDLRQRADWDGAAGNSRRQLLINLQRHIPSSVMMPQKRFATLLDQARQFQLSRCLYHNAPLSPRNFTLYADHQCDRNALPRVTTAILEVHTDEVWNLQWSHSGMYLASASRDKSAIIWRVGLDRDPSVREYSPQHILRDHPYPVGCVAWSLDDSILLTSAEHYINMWNARTGVCLKILDEHKDVVTALAWLPDGSGFISGGLDRQIILWNADGTRRDSWGHTPIRVTDLVVTPDFTRLVAIGMYDGMSTSPGGGSPPAVVTPPTGGAAPASGVRGSENRIIVYDLATKQVDISIRMDGELTSVKISRDSQYALINRAPELGSSCEIQLWDLTTERITRKYIGQKQSRHVIRSCFGGVDENFITSGSEDGNVYIWHRDTGELLEVLPGHGTGSVNSVAWNPCNERMFASCSDDRTIRIWEAPPPHSLGLPALAEAEPTEYKGKGKSRERWDGEGRFATSSSTSLPTSATI
ncbi:hypothetical protein CERSUDRAFT_152691 [Gelatoporia subvermispora B]|uniref:CTLH domain-containing protein n=1 Tax=Ceriporiopsis subvermispora (strain B) TaxID=914234 RepID=M2QM07_CERS8|nr:hypothetical protein CERSUDRAFT_152691 [Gelatoporia subvermispora B]